MSMSSSVYGLATQESQEFRNHEAVLLACYNAGIEELPAKTAEFFGTKWPEPSILKEFRQRSVPYTLIKWEEVMSEIYEVRVSDIPEGVDVIRFVNSY